MKVARTVWTLAKSERIARDEEVIVTLGEPTALHYVNDSGWNALTTEIEIEGALFNEYAADSSNWDIDFGTSGLGLLDMLVSPDGTSIRIRFVNDPADGTIEFKLLGAGNTEGVETNTVTLDVYEENDGGYISSGTDDWIYTTHSTDAAYPGYNEEVGIMSWRTSTYTDDMLISLTTQPMDLPDSDSITIEWMQAWNTESGWDYVNVYYKLDEGSWNQLSTNSGYSAWQQMSYVIPVAPDAETITVMWQFSTDFSVVYPVVAVYIDNLTIIAYEAPDV
ncbi:hypothetical protein [Gudongella oleilytica]|uniref:hypothetical protein n=1 Tax=Gudongella oleilytica TaxID=1582259 RepID=UPI002A369AA1|nr:hypothetical protein [Gudongella oleilytica]MDY0257259.1 hypothetical protein [Gudongella oleilytica]